MKTEAQFIEFLTELRDTLYRLALSITCDSAEAEDVVQDVFERVWHRKDVVLESAYPRAYICRMAHNLSIDRRRTSARRHIFTIKEEIGGDEQNSIKTDIKDMASLTRDIISRLPEKQRLAIHLRDVEGYEIEEIAETLETDEINVRMNLSRARKSVREELIKIMSYGVKRD